MKIDEKIINRLEELIKKGEDVLKTGYSRSSANVVYFGDAGVDSGLSNEWGISSLNILSKAFGKESDHYSKFNALFSQFNDFSPVKRGIGILRAAKDDYENGYLFDTRTLIEAEIFSDIIEQAEELLKKDHYQASAVIAGCVLEDGLRKLCDKNSVTFPKNRQLNR